MAVGFFVEEVECVATVTAAAVFACDGSWDVGDGFHAFVELGGVVEGDAFGEFLDVGIKNAFASDACAERDAVVVARGIDDAWGVVFLAGPKDGHFSFEEIAVAFEFEDGFLA